MALNKNRTNVKIFLTGEKGKAVLLNENKF